MDILHIGGEHTKVGSKIWDRILENRSKFYSKMLRRACSFLNSVICEHHFDKNKIDDARKNIMHLGNQIRIHTELHGATVGNSIRLSDIWGTLIETENFSKCSIAGSFFYDIFGKRYISSTSVGEIIRIISIKHKALSRIDCSQNKVDWKHISHAFRIGLQTRAILTDGCFKFPIDEISLVRDIKFGRLDLNNDVLPKMISIREELLELINKSELPDVPDLCFWNNFILECYSDFYGIRYALPLVSLRE
jgi:hypothetical protein